jgi:hypothetical protein
MYEGRKVSRVTMCEVRSTEKTTKNKRKKKNTMVYSEKKWTLMNSISSDTLNDKTQPIQ